MARQDPTPPATRADIARRRLARLAEAFDADLDPTEAEPSAPTPAQRVTGAHVRVVAVIVVAAGVLLAWHLLAARPDDSAPITPIGLASSDEPSGELVVDVIGDVAEPGIVTLPPGSRVHEAVERAGGLIEGADTSGVNMARRLDDGEQIVVGGAPTDDGASGVGADGRVDLNRATLDELDTLPGVGPVTAQAIIGWRDEHGRFRSVDDLLDVQGIGDATLAKLRDLVTV